MLDHLPPARRPADDLAALRDTASLTRSVLDALDRGVCVVDGAGVILDTNVSWRSMFGLSDVEAVDPLCLGGIGSSVSGVVDSLGQELGGQVRDALDAVAGGRMSHSIVRGQWVGPGGHNHVIVRIHPIPDHDRARAVISMVDVSDMERTRQQLQTLTLEAELLTQVVKQMDQAVVVVGGDGTVEWANDVTSALTGLTAGEVSGHPVDALVAALGFMQPLRGALADGLRRGRRLMLESPAHAAGGTRWLEVQTTPLVEDGRPGRLLVEMRDVTVRRQAGQQLHDAKRRALSLALELREEKTLLADVLHSIPHLVFWKGRDLRYAGVNDAFLALRGLSSTEAVLGRTEAELGLTDALQSNLPDLEAEVLRTGVPVDHLRLEFRTPAGTVRPLMLTLRPQFDDEGAVRGIIGVAADVSEVTALERQLAQASRLESIGQLAAGIAHEINTPVQFVSDNTRFISEYFSEVAPALTVVAEAAADEAAPAAQLRGRLQDVMAGLDLDFMLAEVPQALTQSLEGTERIAHIVRAMKDFAHPGQEWNESDLNRALESTVHISRNEWKYVAECRLDLDPELSTVSCVEGEIKRAVLNLVVNAAQAIGEHRERTGATGLGHIVVRTRKQGSGVLIEVADDGPGMSPDVQMRIFDPFFTTKDVGKGTGQGLSMVHATVVSTHKGSIDVISEPGKGATFRLVLPGVRP